MKYLRNIKYKHSIYMIFFFCALAHSEIDNFINFLTKYIDVSGRYLIGMETSKDTHPQTQGQHLHVCADLSQKQYDSFRKTILVKHYGLQGQARDGNPRQYGVVKKVRDETKMLQYSVKDQNIRYLGITPEEIKSLIENSYKKTPIKDHLEIMMKQIQEKNPIKMSENNKIEADITQIEIMILTYYMDNDLKKVLNKASLKSLTTRYLMYYAKKQYKEQIYYYIMFN